MVIFYHGTQMLPEANAQLMRVAHFGAYGVDLFFILSGWLIGGIFWKAQLSKDGAELFSFWARRWMRTIPPYLAALVLSYAAVAWARSEPFDPAYLIFMQNYRSEIPFFLVSWSLCIEEHFYLVMPIIALALCRFSGRTFWICWIVLCLASSVFRWLEAPEPGAPFGYPYTATHLHFEGLAIGFGLARLYRESPIAFAQVRRWMIPLGLIATIPVVVFDGSRSPFFYSVNSLLVALIACSMLMLATLKQHDFTRSRPGWFAQATYVLAIASYSLYLVHPLTIHVVRLFAGSFGSHQNLFYVAGLAATLPLSMLAFYHAIERPSIMLRERFFPAKQSMPVP